MTDEEVTKRAFECEKSLRDILKSIMKSLDESKMGPELASIFIIQLVGNCVMNIKRAIVKSENKKEELDDFTNYIATFISKLNDECHKMKLAYFGIEDDSNYKVREMGEVKDVE